MTESITRSILLLGWMLASSAAAELPDFGLPGEANILNEEHFGIVNGAITVGVPYRNTLAVQGLYAPPFASSDFSLEVWLFGERVPTESYQWRPIEVERSGRLRGLKVSSTTTLVAGKRAALLTFTVTNPGTQAVSFPVQVQIGASLAYVRTWEFAKPATNKKTTESTGSERLVVRYNDAGAFAVSSDLAGLSWEPWSSHWVTRAQLAPGEQRTWHVCVAAGAQKWAEASAVELVQHADAVSDEARREFRSRVTDLFTKLPRLESTNPHLVAFYNRSLLHLLLNRWEVPEFLLHPYYGTGSVLGGCLGNYLWDFGEPWEIFPLYDPAASKQHIRQFLKIDLTKHFLFDPMTGNAFGPFYPVNQEKIIFLTYYYVLLTGDTGFLNETVNGKSVLDWMIWQACWGDDLTRPVQLIDYGNGNHHLELRGKYRYDYYVPDLNGRRYANYVAAARLSAWAGHARPDLLRRAEDLKIVLKKELWNSQERWFALRTNTGARDFRYTVQIFKLIASPVLDQEEEAGLISHLNESEFLSEWGLHSISKRDVAYDQVDFDNGGGGCFNAFPPQIAERLYRAGHPEQAEDILRRILWWGERVPYWGDSFAANHVEYRKDTPLQSTLDAAAAAQSIIFGMFGVEARPNGDIQINPRPPKFAPRIALIGLHLRGSRLDIRAGEDSFEVTDGNRTLRSRTGVPVIWKSNAVRQVP